MFVLALNFLFHVYIVVKWCLPCKRYDSFSYPGKQAVIPGDETLSPIEFASWVIAMFVHVDARGRFWKFISVKFVTLTVSVQSKGNTQSFMCYRFATTCTYVNSSYVEYALIVSSIVVYSFPPLLPSCCDCCCIAPGIYFHLSRLE